MLIVFSCLGDIYYNSVLEELEMDGQDFKADSWSMAVDSRYLQTHRKNVIKRQDVIYGDNIFNSFVVYWPLEQIFHILLNI